MKSSLVDQKVEVDSLKTEIAQLTAERERLQSLEDLSQQVSQLQDKLESSESARDSDKQAAVDLELKLKEHVARAENAYQTLLEYVSFLPDAD